MGLTFAKSEWQQTRSLEGRGSPVRGLVSWSRSQASIAARSYTCQCIGRCVGQGMRLGIGSPIAWRSWCCKKKMGVVLGPWDMNDERIISTPTHIRVPTDFPVPWCSVKNVSKTLRYHASLGVGAQPRCRKPVIVTLAHDNEASLCILSCLTIDGADGVVHVFQCYWAFPVLIASLRRFLNSIGKLEFALNHLRTPPSLYI